MKRTARIWNKVPDPEAAKVQQAIAHDRYDRFIVALPGNFGNEGRY